jgi:hypothetical protein
MESVDGVRLFSVTDSFTLDAPLLSVGASEEGRLVTLDCRRSVAHFVWA